MFITLKVVLSQGKIKHTTVVDTFKSYRIKSINDIDILFGTYTPIRVIFVRQTHSNTVEYYVFNFNKDAYLLVDASNTPCTAKELVNAMEYLEYRFKGPFLEDDLKCYHVQDPKTLHEQLQDKIIMKAAATHDQAFFHSYLKDLTTMYFL